MKSYIRWLNHQTIAVCTLTAMSLLCIANTSHAGEDIAKTFLAQGYPGSRDRDYVIHLPTDYDEETPAPLVMVLHGCNQTHETIQHDTNFDVVADEEGFIVVYPFITSFEGLRNPNCWGFWFDDEIHAGAGEVEDLWSIIQDVQSEFAVDNNRIHVTGLSSGGAMAVAVMVAHSEHIASGAETAGLPYAETAASVGFSCFNPGTFEAINTVTDAMNQEMADGKRPVPIFIVHSADDCTVNIRAAENLRDAWGLAFNIDTSSPIETQTGNTLGTPWTHTTYPLLDDRSVIETFVVEGKAHGWYGGRDGEFAFADAPDTTRLMWDFFANHPLGTNQPPIISIDQAFTHDNRCITVNGTAQDPDGSVTVVIATLTGTSPQAPEAATIDGQSFSYSVCDLPDNNTYIPVLEATDNEGSTAQLTGTTLTIGNPPTNQPPVARLDSFAIETNCVNASGTATDDNEVISVEARIDTQAWVETSLDSASWQYKMCGLAPGEHQLAVRATDTAGLFSAVISRDFEIDTLFDAEATSTLIQHVIAGRIRNYPNGYGAADLTYLELFDQFGTTTSFSLFSIGGDWYVNVSNAM